MNRSFFPPVPRALLAALFATAAVAAQAADGYVVTPSQEALIAPGMSAATVQQLLGPPRSNLQYHNEAGPTYTYRVDGVEQTFFDIDFDASGTVIAASERFDDDTGSGGRGGRR